jgi:hypothetical protein
MSLLRPAATLLALSLSPLLMPHTASAACMNKFVNHPEGNKQVVTLLTGKFTFDEAKALAAAINAGTSPPVEWLNESGRSIARELGPIKVVRPMPVGCDGKASGVIVVVTFMSPQTPKAKLQLKLGANDPVTFDEQAE